MLAPLLTKRWGPSLTFRLLEFSAMLYLRRGSLMLAESYYGMMPIDRSDFNLLELWVFTLPSRKEYCSCIYFLCFQMSSLGKAYRSLTIAGWELRVRYLLADFTRRSGEAPFLERVAILLRLSLGTTSSNLSLTLICSSLCSFSFWIRSLYSLFTLFIISTWSNSMNSSWFWPLSPPISSLVSPCYRTCRRYLLSKSYTLS